jgi:hypothetical protein
MTALRLHNTLSAFPNVIPAEAGIQSLRCAGALDPRFRGDDTMDVLAGLAWR